MKFKSRLKPANSIMMTPMIDVVFLLLIFFMVTYTQAEKSAHNVNLPKSTTSRSVDVKEVLVITLKKNGDIFIGDKKTSKQTIKENLKKYVKETGKKRIILRGDEYVPYGKLMELMDIAKLSGIEKVSLSTKYKERK